MNVDLVTGLNDLAVETEAVYMTSILLSPRVLLLWGPGCFMCSGQEPVSASKYLQIIGKGRIIPFTSS